MDRHREVFHNPSAIYLAGRRAADAIEASRKTIAGILGSKPGEIVFVGGATEANNLAIGGLSRIHPRARVAISAVEHKAVSQAAEGFFPGRVDVIKVDNRGQVTAESLAKAIKPHTVLVSVAYADSELGSVQDFRSLAKVMGRKRQERHASASSLPLYFHSDASQAANYLDLHVNRLGLDMMSLGGAKIYGPKASGGLYVGHRVPLQPIIFGGGQERGLRSGTEDTASIVGLAEALTLVQAGREAESRRLQALTDKIKHRLTAIDTVTLNGGRRQLPNYVNLTVSGHDGEELVMKLDELGVQVGTGAACSLNSDQPSSVLMAIGLSKRQANSSLRLSLGRFTTAADVQRAVTLLARVIRR